MQRDLKNFVIGFKQLGMQGIRPIVFVLLLLGCKDTNLKHQKLIYPICIDQVDFIPRKLAYDGIEEKLEYNFLYIGKEKDTIQIDYRAGLSLAMGPISPPPPPPPNSNVSNRVNIKDTTGENESWEKWSTEWTKYGAYWLGTNSVGDYRYVGYDSINLSIVVDVHHNVLTHDGLPIPSLSGIAYPVVIKNLEKDTILLTAGRFIELFLEGEKDGEWIVLKQPARYIGCGMGLRYLLLPPNEIFVTSVPVYDWEGSQPLRLRLGNKYSLPFEGKVVL